MIEDFFTSIAISLKPFNKNISEKLKSYSKRILQSSDDVKYKIFDTFLNDIIKDESILERYDSINKSIQQTGKRLIVFIDDLDRLTGKEVLQVLRLIRNTVNFGNTFFVVALDYSYITSVLKKTKLVSNEEQFLKKIFQLIITLPKIRTDIFSRELKNMLEVNSMHPDYKENIERVLDQISYDPSVFDTYAGR